MARTRSGIPADQRADAPRECDWNHRSPVHNLVLAAGSAGFGCFLFHSLAAAPRTVPCRLRAAPARPFRDGFPAETRSVTADRFLRLSPDRGARPACSAITFPEVTGGVPPGARLVAGGAAPLSDAGRNW